MIPGGSGQVGVIVAGHFHGHGHDVTVLARNPKPAPWKTVHWTGYERGPWVSSLDGADVVINLAGRNVNCRYNQANRLAIKRSRVETTRLIGEAIAESAHPPGIWMNASTATIYRHALDRPMDEPHGELGGSEPYVPETWRFSIDVATSWERTFFDVPTPRTRKVALRSALTLSADRGGIFDVLLGLVSQDQVRIGFGKAVRFVDSLHRFSTGNRLSSCASRTGRTGQSCIAESSAESRFYAATAESLGSSRGITGHSMDARVGRNRSSNGNRVGAEKPARDTNTTRQCRF